MSQRRIVIIFCLALFFGIGFYFFNKGKDAWQNGSLTESSSQLDSATPSTISPTPKAMEKVMPVPGAQSTNSTTNTSLTERPSKTDQAAVTQNNNSQSNRNPSSQNGTSPGFKSIEELQKAFGPNWRALTDDSAQDIKSILVKQATSPILNATNVTDFVLQLRPLFGADNAELTLQARRDRPNCFDLSQSINGYSVYGAYVRVITHPETFAPITINNELQSIDSLDQRILITRQEALDKVDSEFIKPDRPLKISVDETPVAYPYAKGEAVLAWIVHAQWSKNHKLNVREFVVSATDSKVLYIRNQIVN